MSFVTITQLWFKSDPRQNVGEKHGCVLTGIYFTKTSIESDVAPGHSSPLTLVSQSVNENMHEAFPNKCNQ